MSVLRIFTAAIIAMGLSLGAISAPAFADHKAAHNDAGGHTLFSGVWTKKSFKSSGTWEIYEQGGAHYVKLSSDFKTRRAPDLKIFLSPKSASETNGRNATDGSLLVAPLRKNSGEQVYKIPDGADISAYQSILIHCEQYAKLWSAADLS